MILLFSVMMISVFGRLIIWGIRAAWGIGKMIFSLIFLPIVLIGLACTGMIYIALVVLIICGIVTLIGSIK
jgi:hypothetical protein